MSDVLLGSFSDNGFSVSIYNTGITGQTGKIIFGPTAGPTTTVIIPAEYWSRLNLDPSAEGFHQHVVLHKLPNVTSEKKKSAGRRSFQ